MTKNTKAILDLLDERYGTDYRCYLNHENAWQLLIATILSAQCTDARVNIVTESLFRKYPDVAAFAAADLKELEKDIHSTGFYHNKAKNIIACCILYIPSHFFQYPNKFDNKLNFKKITIKSWNADAPSYEESSMKSSSTRTYDEEVVRNSNKLDYYLTEDGQKVKLFSTDYSIDSNVFKAKTHVEAEDIQHLIKNDAVSLPEC